jgi:hypothetical protein
MAAKVLSFAAALSLGFLENRAVLLDSKLSGH